jgi:hypothetical protein
MLAAPAGAYLAAVLLQAFVFSTLSSRYASFSEMQCPHSFLPPTDRRPSFRFDFLDG